MPYTSRLLPPEEWPRLVGTDLETIWPNLSPEDAQVVVVEREGRIVGAVSVIRQVVLEGLWVAPEFRGHSTIAGRVVDLARRAARKWGVAVVFTLPATDSLVAQAIRLGGVQLPRVVVVPVAQE